jgi:hypothetical protein
MFPAVSSFMCEESHKGSKVQMLGWQGESGEVVTFDTPLAMPRGEPLEGWMCAVEATMHATLRARSKAALKGSAVLSVADWVGGFPRQAVLLVDQVVWTDMVHATLHEVSQGQTSALRGLYEQHVSRVDFLAHCLQRLNCEPVPPPPSPPPSEGRARSAAAAVAEGGTEGGAAEGGDHVDTIECAGMSSDGQLKTAAERRIEAAEQARSAETAW